jgi:hypothetical protein
MTFHPRIKTALACEMAELDRDRFNEAVAAGHYPCAPETRPGSSRIFSVDDCVALYIYARLIDDGIPPSRAGGMICEVFLPELKGDPDCSVEFLTEVKGRGLRIAVPTTSFDLHKDFYGGAAAVYRRIWPVGLIRRAILDRLEFEFQTSPVLGDD